MKISILLIICLQLFEYGESNFLAQPKWNWTESCKNHPFADTATPTMKEKIGICTLVFHYPDKLNLAADDIELRLRNKDDIKEAWDFCRMMYPDAQLESPKLNNEKMTCTYQRNRECLDADAYPIGDKCVSVSNTAEHFHAAEKSCKDRRGAWLISTGDKAVIHHFSRLYKWHQPTPAVWANDSDGNPHHIYMQYSAIGGHQPGSSVRFEGDKTKTVATVMCIGESINIPGGKEIVSYCDMLTTFLKIKAFENGNKNTCYHISQSLMIAKKNTKDPKPATVDHFNTACKVRNGQLNFAVAPTSEEQKKALIKSKKNLLLPGALSQYWTKAQNATRKELFRYTITRKIAANTYKDVKTGVNTGSAFMEQKTSVKGFMERGVLLWMKDGKYKDMESGYRAPIMCGSGLNTIQEFVCPNGYEMAHHDYTALCFKVYPLNCPHINFAMSYCKHINPESMMAPMSSAEDERALIDATNRVTKDRNDVKKLNVMLGGWKPSYNNPEDHSPFIWHWDGKEIGNSQNKKYDRWVEGKPRMKSSCTWFTNNCIYEGCVALHFDRTDGIMKPRGLNDVYCEKPCESSSHTLAIACAEEATIKEV